MSPINLTGPRGAPKCDHHWVAHVKGGEPLSVSTCSQCGVINWDLLREDYERSLVEKMGLTPNEEIHICGDKCSRNHAEFRARRPGKVRPENPELVQEIREVVNAEETAEDTARRYAGQLLALQEGLLSRGVDLTMATEEDMVPKALEELDRLREHCSKLEKSLKEWVN